jgi:competence protein ComEC
MITTDRYPEYRYGDELKISGVLQEPPAFDGFDYKIYLAKSGIFSVMAKPAIERTAERRGNIVYEKIFALKNALRQSLYQNLPYPHSALMAGILLGDQNSLPQCSAKEALSAEESGQACLKLKEEFNISGLRHLTAVSGMHIAIMVPALIGLALAAGLWRQQAICFAVAVIWIFILMIGFPASAVRAGIMGMMMVFAQIAGRPANGGRLVAIAAAFMILQNPLLLRYDVGFQLSFLAVMGMINLAPVFSELLVFIPEWAGELKSVLAQTMAAQVFTLPILVFNFGYVSLYAPLANLLVVPLIALMTILGFLLAGVGLILGCVAWLVSLPNWLLLEYLLRTVSIISRLPYAALDLQISWHYLAVFYVALGFIIMKIESWRKMRFLGI